LRLLLDTNVLVLWIAGNLQPSLIGQHRRLREYDDDDFAIVDALARQSEDHISTPHILTETSNFLGAGPQQMVAGGSDALNAYIAELDEIYTPAKTIAAMPEMLTLGLADTAVYDLGAAGIQIVSMDFHLCNRLHQKGVDAVNPRHFR
jgi:hypothetical protein